MTGAGSGIGRACALELGKRGFAVAAIDLDEKGARETVAQIPGARAYRADVSIGTEVDATVSAALAHQPADENLAAIFERQVQQLL